MKDHLSMQGYFLKPSDLDEFLFLILSRRPEQAVQCLNFGWKVRYQNLAVLPKKFDLFWDYVCVETPVQFPWDDWKQWRIPHDLIDPVFGKCAIGPLMVFSEQNAKESLLSMQDCLNEELLIRGEQSYIGVKFGQFAESREYLENTLNLCLTEDVCFMLWDNVSVVDQ